MTEEQRKVAIPVTLDATHVKQGAGEIKAAVQDMGQAVAQAGKTAATGVEGIGAATEKLTVQQNRILDSIKRTTVLSTEGKAAYLEQRAAMAGVSDAASPYIAKLKLAEQGQVALGNSAKQTAAAMRGVPAQFTDIITSIQGGQRPMSVLLQQGGQLKDMFGGIGPAARALGGYILGLVNPVTLAAGAIGGIAYAAHQGSSELRGFQNAATITGNAIGQSASQFAAMRDGIAGIAGTKGKAAEALTAIAANGRIAGSAVQGIAEAAILMEKATGQSIAKTVEQFADLAKSPAEASAKLNEQYNFLTASVYKQIKALEDQGRAVDAANLAEQTYADAMKGRAQTVIDNAGLMEKAWRGITGAAKGAWDSMLNIGRADTLAQQLASVRGEIASATGQDKNRPFRMPWEEGLDSLRLREANLSEQIRLEARVTAEKAEQARLEALGIQFLKDGDQFLDKKQQREKELTKARTEGQALVNAGIITQTELEKRLAGIREKFKESAKAGPKTNAFEMEAMKQYSQAMEAFEKIAGAAAAKTEELSKTQAKLREIQSSPVWAEYSRQKQEQLIWAAALSQAEEDQAEATKRTAQAAKEAAAEYAKYAAEQEKDLDKLREQVEREADHVAAIGLTKEAVSVLAAAKLDAAAATKIKAAAEIEERDGDLSLAKVYREQATELQKLADLKRQGGIKETAAEMEREYKKTADSINNSLTDALLRGFESGKGFAKNFRDTLKNMFSTLVPRPIIQGVMSPISGMVNGFVQGVTGGPGTGYLGMASNTYSMYNSGSSLYSLGSQYLGGTMSGANAAGSFYANATGTGIDGLLATNGAYGTAGGSAAAGSGGAGMASTLGSAAAIAVIAYAAIEAWQSTRGEKRGGGRFDLDPLTGKTSFTNGPDGERAAGSDDIVKGIISATSVSLNEAFKSFGSTVTVAALAGAYETSANGRGGVFSGGRLSSGVAFGESGAGTNYEWDPLNPASSKYETWFGSAMNGDPGQLATDLQQSYIAAIQASVGLIPKLVLEQYALVSTPSGSQFHQDGSPAFVPDGPEFGTRLLRVFDDEMKDSVRELGLLPKKVLDLIIDVDPEALSAEATAELTGKIAALVANVNGFRAIVDVMPVAQLRAASFDIAASLVEMSGGIEQFGNNLGAYVENFYSDVERREFVAGNISKTLAGAGIEIDPDTLLTTTREQFRLMVEGQDLSTESGQKAYATLLSVAGAFAGISPAAAEAAEAVAQMLASLKAEGESLQVDLLRAQGKGSEADAMQRALDTNGFTDLEIAAYDANEALRALIKSTLEQADAAREAAIAAATGERDRAQTAADDFLTTAGDLAGAMAEINPAALTLVDTWRNTTSELTALTTGLAAALGELPAPTTLEQFAANMELIRNIAATSADLQDQILGIRVGRGDQAAVDLLKARESALFGEMATGDDPAGTAKELARITLQRIQLEGKLESQAINDRYKSEIGVAQTIADLEKKNRAAQIDALREQITGAERLADIAASMQGYIAQLKFGELSALNPVDQLAAARSEYERVLAAAKAGDVNAAGMLQGASSAFLQEQQKFSGGATSGYASTFSQVMADLEAFGMTAVSDTTILQDQLTQLEALQTASETLQTAVVDTSQRQIDALGAIDYALTSRGDKEEQRAASLLTAVTAQLDEMKAAKEAMEARIVQAAATHKELLEKVDGLQESLDRLVNNSNLEAAVP